MQTISFQQAFALASGCFISPLSNTKFDLTDESGLRVDLKTLVSGNQINLSLLPSLTKDGTLDPENQSYSIADSSILSNVFTTYGTITSSILRQGQPKFIFTPSASDLPENFKNGTTSYLLSSFGPSVNALLSGTTGRILPEAHQITSIRQIVTGLALNINTTAFAIPGSIQITFNSESGFAGSIVSILNRSAETPLGFFNFFDSISFWRIKITGVVTEPNLNGTFNIFPYYNEFVDNIVDLVNIPIWNPSRTYKRGEFVSFPLDTPVPGQEYRANILYSLEDNNTQNPGASPSMLTPGSLWHTVLATGVTGEFVEEAAFKIGPICLKRTIGSSSLTLTIPYNAFRQFKIGNNGLETQEANPWYVSSWNNIENNDLILNEGTITFEPIYINKQGLNVTDLPPLSLVTMNNNAQQTVAAAIKLQVLEQEGGLIFKEGGSFDSSLSVSDTEKLYHFTGQKTLKKLK